MAEALDGDALARLVTWYQDAEDANITARDLAKRDMDWYDGKQLTAEEIDTLEKRGQPTTIFNSIGGKVDFQLGLEIQQRTDPKALPRTPDDEQAANAATDAMRFVEEKEDLDTIFTNSYEDMIKGGYEGVEVLVRETNSGQVEVDIKRPPFDRMFYDPHSSRGDFADARYYGYILWMDSDQAMLEWPDHAAELQATVTETSGTEYEDKPISQRWASGGGRPRIRIVTMYWKQGEQWFMTKYTKTVVLEHDPVPYIDDEGVSVNPMVMQAAYVDRDNNRYGAVRRLIGPQDEENKRRQKFLHTITMRQTTGEKGAVDNVREMKKQLARPDGHVETNPGLSFGLLDQSASAAGQAALLNHADKTMDNMGANAALQGQPQGDPSGRAIIASQQGGVVELTPVTERHRSFKQRVYEQIWLRIRQYWTEERWIRVTDDEKNMRWVGFNRQTTVGAQLAEDMTDDGMSEEEIRARMLEVVQTQGLQVLQQPIVVNVPANMDMDVSIETAPDTVSIQQEQFEELTALLSTGMSLNDPRLKLLIKASSLRNKDELLEMIEGGEEPSEEQQIAQQAELNKLVISVQQASADLQKTLSEINENTASATKSRSGAVKDLAEVDEKDGVIDGQFGSQALAPIAG